MARTNHDIPYGEDLIGVGLLLTTLLIALFLARLVAAAVIGVGTLMTG